MNIYCYSHSYYQSSSRNVEIQFNSLQILAKFVTTEECGELIAESREIVPFCVDGFRNARSQCDFFTNKYKTRYGGSQFLKLLSHLSAASSVVCSEFLRLDGLAEVAAALQLDPNGSVGNIYFSRDVLHSTNILWHILLADNGLHVTVVRDHREVLPGTPSALLFF